MPNHTSSRQRNRLKEYSITRDGITVIVHSPNRTVLGNAEKEISVKTEKCTQTG